MFRLDSTFSYLVVDQSWTLTSKRNRLTQAETPKSFRYPWPRGFGTEAEECKEIRGDEMHILSIFISRKHLALEAPPCGDWRYCLGS